MAYGMEGKFIKLRVIVSEDGKKTADSIWPLSFIKNISKVEVQSEIIQSLTPVIGKCAVTFFDGNQAMLDHSLEEMCEILQAVDAPKLGAAIAEAKSSLIQ